MSIRRITLLVILGLSWFPAHAQELTTRFDYLALNIGLLSYPNAGTAYSDFFVPVPARISAIAAGSNINPEDDDDESAVVSIELDMDGQSSGEPCMLHPTTPGRLILLRAGNPKFDEIFAALVSVAHGETLVSFSIDKCVEFEGENYFTIYDYQFHPSP